MGKPFLAGTLLLLAVAAFTANSPSGPQAPTAKTSGTGSQNAATQSSMPSPSAGTSSASRRKIPCKTPENSSLCYWTRGRLSVYEGGAPNFRLWKIGTRRLLGIFSGPSHFPPAIEEYDESPELPTTLLRAYEADNRRMKKTTGTTWTIPPPVFAYFEVCPLERDKKGEMQAVCSESAKNIFVEPDD